ncbi:hypothetical protein [Brevibacillus daliensis]|uniref:hypothetical protein n=1 Tax=Brevibacillus daliensis TaxID=2892995 RepID=UPI001E3B2DA5|nr:hypothetical protein [Brevibacillus daliensis]
MYINRGRFQPNDDGRYLFELKTHIKSGFSWEVDMPSLPLEQGRYVSEEGQNIQDFPRLYVDGSSWVWKYATVKKKHLNYRLESEIADYEIRIKEMRQLITELKE